MACGDVLSLEDLQTAKKHQIFEAEVITGKAGGVAGGANIDTATNPVTGQTQQTLPSLLADLGFDVQSWTSSTGGVLASANQVFLNDTPGSLGLGDYYAWGGTFPKTVPAGTDPALPTSGYIMRSSRFAGTQAREALRRSYAEAGYNLVDGSFEAGGTLVSANDVLLQERTGKAFSGPAGAVAAGTNPASGGFVDRSSAIRAPVTYAGIRAYSGQSTELRCVGRQTIFDHGFGDFVRDDTDTTSPDNDGTVLVDALSRRWKRLFMGYVNVMWFGADPTGLTPIDAVLAATVMAAATGGNKVYLPRGTYLLNSTAVVAGSLVGDGSDCVTINFKGTGWSIIATNGLEYGGFRLVSGGAEQSGFLLRGGVGPNIRDIITENFDMNGVQLGQAGAGGAGVYLGTIDRIQCINSTNTGNGVGFCIDGLSLPNSNSNHVSNVFVKGKWKTLYSIRGNANSLYGCDAEPNNSGTFGGVTSVVEIRGTGNRWENLYLEPVGGTLPVNLFNLPTGSRNNKVIGIYAPSAGGTPYALITDAGTGNEVDFAPTGPNFTQSVGVPRSSTNLIPNADFININASKGMPVGWSKSVTGTSTVMRSTELLRGGPYSLRFECSGDGRATASCFIATNIPGTRGVLRHIRRDKLVGKTVTYGAWCYSTTPGFGAIKISDGATSYGSSRHSGGGDWEFLSVQVSIPNGPTEVAVELRSDVNNLNSTGICYFTEPVLVFGTDVPQVPAPAPLTDGEAVMAGRFIGSPWQTFTPNASAPSILEGNFFKTANNSATTISNFSDVPTAGAQIIYLRAGDANTTIANNSNIMTLSGSNKLLTNGAIYKFVWDASAAKWIEF